jgi:hypothetical protein
MLNVYALKRAQDMPLFARSIRRVGKSRHALGYVYEIALHHESGRLYGRERFTARDMPDALQRCQRLYPTTVFLPKR